MVSCFRRRRSHAVAGLPTEPRFVTEALRVFRYCGQLRRPGDLRSVECGVRRPSQNSQVGPVPTGQLPRFRGRLDSALLTTAVAIRPSLLRDASDNMTQMMTPAEQLKRPRETELALKTFLADCRFEAASVMRYGDTPRSLFDPVVIQLCVTKKSTSANDLIIQLLGWEFVTEKHNWDHPQIECQLVHEWGLQSAECDRDTCQWVILDGRAEFEVHAQQLIWATRSTKFPGWFPPDLFSPDDGQIS